MDFYPGEAWLDQSLQYCHPKKKTWGNIEILIKDILSTSQMILDKNLIDRFMATFLSLFLWNLMFEFELMEIP